MLAGVLAEEGKFQEAIAFAEQGRELYAAFLGDTDSYVQKRRADIDRMRRGNIGSYLDE